MKLYPINLNIKNKKCLVVGGGNVALRKAKRLSKFGAEVFLVAEEIKEDVAKLDFKEVKIKRYSINDLKDAFLVFAATNNKELNLQIKKDASKLNILCNVASNPEQCDFTLPALVEKKHLQIAISSSNTSPALSKKIRKQLEKQFDDEKYDKITESLKKTRKKEKGLYLKKLEEIS